MSRRARARWAVGIAWLAVGFAGCRFGIRYMPTDGDFVDFDASAPTDCDGLRRAPRSPSCPTGLEPHCARVAVALPTRWVVGPNSALDTGRFEASGARTLWLDAFEVSVRRYRAFVASGTHAVARSVRYPDGSTLTASAGAPASPEALCTFDRGDEAQPMNCVSWSEAQAFCAWDGGRLPTIAELEFVRRWWDRSGVERADADGRRFPWGEASARDHFVPYPASLPANRSPIPPAPRVDDLEIGCVFGLAGGVSEWLADTTVPSGVPARYDGPCFADGFCEGALGDPRVVSTGHWAGSDEERLRSSEIVTRTDSEDRIAWLGFRCAYDAP